MSPGTPREQSRITVRGALEARRDTATSRRTMKTAHAFGLALLLALALTDCSSSAKHTAGGPSGAGTPTASVSATTAPTTGAQVTMPATSARPGRCDSSVLSVSLGQSQGAAGHSNVALLLTNRSSVTCTLAGYPGVSFTAGTDAHKIGTSAERDHRFSAAPVTVVPGATVHATVGISNYSNYVQQACLPAQATGFRIYPPGSAGSLLVAAPQTVCSKPGVQGIQTSVVRTGTSPD